MEQALHIASAYRQLFGPNPLLCRAPGRINLIGEHTDYNQGWVMPAAIDKAIYIAIGKAEGPKSSLYAFDLKRRYEFLMNDVQPVSLPLHRWANYLLGVVKQFQLAGAELPAFNCVFGGNVPSGAGLSSSAAVECALAFALNELFGLGFEKMQLAKMAQAAEHSYAGVQCGIMDQFASLFGQAGQVLRLDCQSLEYSAFPLDTERYALLLCNSGVKHSLASSEYNVRRQECETGLLHLRRHAPELAEGLTSLRQVPPDLLEAARTAMPEVVYRRCRYVLDENERVHQVGRALLQGNMPALGQCLYASHRGLQHQYQVSCPELDALVDYAEQSGLVLGARMMGGGFGGCTLNLLEKQYVEQFSQQVAAFYQKTYGIAMQPIAVRASQGASVM